MCFRKTEPSKPPIVIIIWHSITDTFHDLRGGFSDRCPNLFEFVLHLLWCSRNVFVHIFWLFFQKPSHNESQKLIVYNVFASYRLKTKTRYNTRCYLCKRGGHIVRIRTWGIDLSFGRRVGARKQ